MKPTKFLLGLAFASPAGWSSEQMRSEYERTDSTKVPAPSRVLPPPPLPSALPSPIAQGNISKNNAVLPFMPLPSVLPSPFAQGSSKATIPTQGSREAEMESSSFLQRFRSVTPWIDGVLAALEGVRGGAPRLTEARIAPDLYYPNPIWFNREPTENIRCYSYARNDLSHLRNPNPGSIGGKPIKEPLTCEKVLDTSQKDGLKKPIEQAADGCSVKCPEDHHAVFVLVGDFEKTYYVVQNQADGKTSKYPVQITKGKDFHYYRQDQNVTVYPAEKVPKKEQADDNNKVFEALQRIGRIGAHQEKDGTYKLIVKDNKIHQAGSEISLRNEDVEAAKRLRRYSHKQGTREPTNLDGAGDEFSCPPRAFHAYTDIDTQWKVKIGGRDNPAIIITTTNYKPCEEPFLCAPTTPDYPGYQNPSSLPLKQQLIPAAGLERAMRSSNASSYVSSDKARTTSPTGRTSPSRTG